MHSGRAVSVFRKFVSLVPRICFLSLQRLMPRLVAVLVICCRHLWCRLYMFNALGSSRFCFQKFVSLVPRICFLSLQRLMPRLVTVLVICCRHLWCRLYMFNALGSSCFCFQKIRQPCPSHLFFKLTAVYAPPCRCFSNLLPTFRLSAYSSSPLRFIPNL